MTDRLLDRCNLLIANRDAIKRAFPWESSLLHLCAASLYTARNVSVDTECLLRCKELLHSRVSMFNNFRSTCRLTMMTMMDLSGDPEATLENALTVYALLKEQLWTSDYLPLVAMMIAQQVPAVRYAEVVTQTRTIYDRMKKEHPFLTGSEDCTSCALMALSGQPVDLLIQDMEACYDLLRGRFYAGNALQSLTHTLALYPGQPAQKAAKVLDLFDAFRDRDHKWSKDSELPILGILAMTCGTDVTLVDEILEVEAWLETQKGFGFWGSISTKQQRMYAGLLVLFTITDDTTHAEAALVTSGIATIAAQQAMLCALIASSSAAAAASANHG